jgi:hypothetical protein
VWENEQQDDKENRPVVGEQQAQGPHDRAVAPAQQRIDEQAKADADHEQAHAVSGPSLPRDQAAHHE